MQLAHGHRRKVFSSKVRIAHLSSHIAIKCYSLNHPRALRQQAVIQFIPFCMLALIYLHFCHSISEVSSVTTTQIKKQRHSIYAHPLVSHDTNGLLSGWAQMWGAASKVCFPTGTVGMQTHTGDSASMPCAAGACSLSSHCISEDNMWAELVLGQGFPSPSCISTMLFILLGLSQYSVPAHIMLLMLFSTTCLWHRMNFTFPDENMDA